MFRFAIYAAVSSPEQAKKEKVSLDDQIDTARAFGLRQGGQESAGPYVLDGYSRTGYEGLAEAAAEIPQLAHLLDDLKSNRFDVLVMDNFDRLGDIAQMLRVRFKKHSRQLVSARQSGSIVPVDLYDPYKDESTDISMHVEGIVQAYRINKIRRAWNAGVPNRIDRGLHPLSLPFGYRLVGQGQPAALIPEQADLLRQMKEWMLSGLTYTDIAHKADEITPPPRASHWTRNVVKRILTNPFYAGIVIFGRKQKGLPAARSQWRVGQGKHEPLWDEATHHSIVAEAARRLEGKRNFKAQYPFTGLPVCGVCDGKINKHGRLPYEYLSCQTWSHWHMRYDQAVPLITQAVIKALRKADTDPPIPIDQAPLKEQMKNLQARRERVQAGYESGLYTASEASKKLNALEERITETFRKIEQAESYERTKHEWRERVGGIQPLIDKLPELIERGDPVRINQLLTALIRRIVLRGNNIHVQFRD